MGDDVFEVKGKKIELCPPVIGDLERMATRPELETLMREVAPSHQTEEGDFSAWARDHALLHNVPNLVGNAENTEVATKTIRKHPREVGEVLGGAEGFYIVLWGLTGISPGDFPADWQPLLADLKVAKTLGDSFHETYYAGLRESVNHNHQAARILGRGAIEAGLRAACYAASRSKLQELTSVLEQVKVDEGTSLQRCRGRRISRIPSDSTLADVGFIGLAVVLCEGGLLSFNSFSTLSEIYGASSASVHSTPGMFESVLLNRARPKPDTREECPAIADDLELFRLVSDIVLSTWLQAIGTRFKEVAKLTAVSVNSDFLAVLKGSRLTKSMEAYLGILRDHESDLPPTA
ncbi:MAG: hypothetical protein JRN35_04860 [Nitrososphaerota archaeon]|jgi:hypothetical protein|nr:hypothetical protein [Nitrososphaerota archaeon]